MKHRIMSAKLARTESRPLAPPRDEKVLSDSSLASNSKQATARCRGLALFLRKSLPQDGDPVDIRRFFSVFHIRDSCLPFIVTDSPR
ncbi:MAG: hypothetical protein HXY51_01825 [Nitrospirae bacterium]|nr:hypothetical protein [Nitrospirota bacterium]